MSKGEVNLQDIYLQPEGALINPPEKPEGLERERPADSYGLVYIIFFLSGIAMLLPWNGEFESQALAF